MVVVVVVMIVVVVEYVVGDDPCRFRLICLLVGSADCTNLVSWGLILYKHPGESMIFLPPSRRRYSF